MNPFIEAAVEVLKVECNIQAQRGNLTLHKSAMTTNEVTVLLSMIGQVQGVVMYGLSIETARNLVSRVMEQEFPEFDSLAQSGTAELGNVITGRATIKLSKAGIASNISPPTLILGQGITISTLDFGRIVVPLVTEAGEILVHLALRESPPGMQDTNFVPVMVPNASDE
jgi:chemotaxis protein CheX